MSADDGTDSGTGNGDGGDGSGGETRHGPIATEADARFPFPSYREHQREALVEAAAAILDDDIEVLILDLPTGTGKSGINTTLCRLCDSSFMTTPQRALRDQLRDDDVLNDHYAALAARDDYICYASDEIGDAGERRQPTCAECPINKLDLATCAENVPGCRYWLEKERAMLDVTAVLTFAYLIVDGRLDEWSGTSEELLDDVREQARAGTHPALDDLDREQLFRWAERSGAEGTEQVLTRRVSFGDRELLVIDEAHALVDQVSSLFLGFTLRKSGALVRTYNTLKSRVAAVTPAWADEPTVDADRVHEWADDLFQAAEEDRRDVGERLLTEAVEKARDRRERGAALPGDDDFSGDGGGEDGGEDGGEVLASVAKMDDSEVGAKLLDHAADFGLDLGPDVLYQGEKRALGFTLDDLIGEQIHRAILVNLLRASGESPDLGEIDTFVRHLDQFVEDYDEGTPWVADAYGTLDAADDDDGHAETEGEAFRVEMKPVHVGPFLQRAIWSRAGTVVLSTATMPFRSNPGTWLDQLGLPSDEGDYHVVSKPTPFPVANRPILTTEMVGSFSGTALPEHPQRHALAERIRELADRHEGERGLVHVASYKQAEWLANHPALAGRARAQVADGANTQDQLRAWINGVENAADYETPGWLTASRAFDDYDGKYAAEAEAEAAAAAEADADPPQVFISPSAQDGVNLPGDDCRWQALAKVPYPPTKGRWGYLVEKLEAWDEYFEAVGLAVVQSAGRAVRSRDDHAVYYVLDSAFTTLRDRVTFPPWFEAAIDPPASVLADSPQPQATAHLEATVLSSVDDFAEGHVYEIPALGRVGDHAWAVALRGDSVVGGKDANTATRRKCAFDEVPDAVDADGDDVDGTERTLRELVAAGEVFDAGAIADYDPATTTPTPPPGRHGEQGQIAEQDAADETAAPEADPAAVRWETLAIRERGARLLAPTAPVPDGALVERARRAGHDRTTAEASLRAQRRAEDGEGGERTEQTEHDTN